MPETTYADNTMSFTFNAASPAVGSLSYTVSQIRTAYGINSIPDFGSATADGSGQTIAIVDAYNDPTILTDLDGFDEAMNLSTNSSPTLYQQYGPASSFLTVFNQTGTNITSEIGNSGVGAVPPVDPTGSWEGEETLDVEWAHAIAPGAEIDLIECDGTGATLMGSFTGAATAAELPGVTVVSMSWIWNEGNWSGSSGSGERAYDSSTFVTPSGHPGVTFLASTGDGGTPGGYPAFSPNVVAVGATQLSLERRRLWQRNRLELPDPAHARQRQRVLLPDRHVDVAIGRLQRHLQHGRGREQQLGDVDDLHYLLGPGLGRRYRGVRHLGGQPGQRDERHLQDLRWHRGDRHLAWNRDCQSNASTGRHQRRQHAVPGAGRLLPAERYPDRRPEREFRQRHRGRRRRRHRPSLGHRRRSEPV